MRKKSLLAIAVLLTTLAGCTLLPQASVAPGALDYPRTSIDPRVSMRVQGVGESVLGAATLTITRGYQIGADALNQHLGFIVSQDAEIPADAIGVRLLKVDQNAVYPYVVVTDESQATHKLYRFATLRDSELALMEATFDKFGLSPSKAVITRFSGGTIRFIDPSSAVSYSNLLSLEFPTIAKDHFSAIESDDEAAPTAYRAYNLTSIDGMQRIDAHHLELSFTLQNTTGKPLTGLSEKYLDVWLERTVPSVENPTEYEAYPIDPDQVTIALKELGEGRYSLIADFVPESPLHSVKVELTIRNPPLIHDKEYQ